MLTAVDVRKRRILGAVSVAFGVLLIVLAIMAMTGSLGATAKKPASADAAATQDQQQGGSGSSDSGGASSGGEAPQAEKMPLTVLNGSGTPGLAAAAQAEFEAQQWEIAEVGNYTEQAPDQSTVYYPAGDDAAKASAELLVSDFDQLTAAEAPDNFNYEGLVVVLAGEWPAG